MENILKSDGMADVPQAGIPAFSSWLAQISDAFSNGFRRLGQNEAVYSEVSVKDESSEAEQNLRLVHGSGVDVSSMDPQETVLRGQGDTFDYAPSGERLTPISEHSEELESRRSLQVSRCSDVGKMWVNRHSSGSVRLFGPFLLSLSVHLDITGGSVLVTNR